MSATHRPLSRTTLLLFGVLGLAVTLVTMAAGQEEPPPLSGDESIDEIGYRDREALVRTASDVFFGVVKGEAPYPGIAPSPEFAAARTFYAVEVREVLKGSLGGTVLVNQDGGDGDFLDGDGQLLNEQEYLFIVGMYQDPGPESNEPIPGIVRMFGGAQSHVLVTSADQRAELREEIARYLDASATPFSTPSAVASSLVVDETPESPTPTNVPDPTSLPTVFPTHTLVPPTNTATPTPSPGAEASPRAVRTASATPSAMPTESATADP